MREILIVLVALVLAVIISTVLAKPVLTSAFLKHEQVKAEKAMQHEIEKAKKTHEANKGKK